MAVQTGIAATDAPEMKYLASVLAVTPNELVARMQQQVFKGEMRRPAVLRSSADCVALARSTPGAICIVASGTPLTPDTRAVAVR